MRAVDQYRRSYVGELNYGELVDAIALSLGLWRLAPDEMLFDE